MITVSQYLFIYGTLLAHGNVYAQYLRQHCKLIGSGKFGGKLYDTGKYPAAILYVATGGHVYGSIYLMNEVENLLDMLDEYEGIGTNEPTPHEYIRQLVKIDAGHETIACWVYIYNWPIIHLQEVPDGKYLDYINQRNNI